MWPAWQWIWDELADGEWHRAAMLAEGALAEGVVEVDRGTIMGAMNRAFRSGLIEREQRMIQGADERYNPGLGTLRMQRGLSRPRRPMREAWYRRKPEAV